MTEELMEVISGASHGSYSFVHENFIYRINKFTNKRVYLSCRLSYCRGAGKGVKGATRGEVYNFKLTKPHNHPAEEHKIRLFEVKQYVRDEARLTGDSSKDIYERAVQQFSCYDISRACVEGLVKRSRERSNSRVKHPKRKYKRTPEESSSETEETAKKKVPSEKEIQLSNEDSDHGVELEECEEEFDNVQEAAIVEVIRAQETGVEEPPVVKQEEQFVQFKGEELYEEQFDKVAAGIIVSADDNTTLDWNNKSVPSSSELTLDVTTDGSESDSQPESSDSSDDLDDYPRHEALRKSSELKSHKTFDSKQPRRSSFSCGVSEIEEDEGYENQESLEESLLKIYSTSYFSSKENVFKLLCNPQESVIDDDDDGTHSVNSSNALKIIKSAFKLCKFATVKASQVRRLLIGKTNDVNDLEDILVEHLSSLMCFSGTEFFQKCFGQSLREAIESGKSDDVRSKHAWSEEEIVVRGSDKRMQLAVALQCYSGKAYSALGELVDLPGPHITRKWATNSKGYPGFTGQSFAVIRDEVIRLKDQTINVCLTMEDVPLRKAIEWENDQLTGYTDLGFGRLESDGIPEATRAIIFYASALNSNWKMPVGYCLTDHLSAQVRANLLCQYISKLEFCGVKCIGVVLNDSVTSNHVFEEFGVFVKGALPQGSFHTNADEKCRVSPFFDTMELMRSIKFLLKEKKALITTTGQEVLWYHIEYAEELLQTDSANWAKITGCSFADCISYLSCFKETVKKEKWPFGKYLSKALQVLKRLGIAEFINADPTISFVSHMVTITEVFSCPNKFIENRLALPNHKDSFTTVNKWIHYIGNMKFPGGQFVRDSDRKMPLMNLCMNLSSLKVVIRRTFDSFQAGLLNRFSLDNVKDLISQMGLNQNELPTPKQFREKYLQVILCSVSTSPSNNIVIDHDGDSKPPDNIVGSTFHVSNSYIYTPVSSMCDCIEDFFLEKVVNIWMESTNCAECYEIVLATMQNYSPLNPGLLKDLLSMLRIAENQLGLIGEFSVDLVKRTQSFHALANSVLLEMTSVRGFKCHGHLFNNVEFGEICHFTQMIKDILRIYLLLRLMYLSREIKIGINDFQNCSLKYRMGVNWA